MGCVVVLTRVMIAARRSLSFETLLVRSKANRLNQAEGGGKYLNLCPARKAVARAVAALHELTSKRQSCKPLPVVIAELNRQTRGWSHYFRLGYPAKVCKRINGTILTRLQQHLNRRHQRHCKKPVDESYYAYFKRQGGALLNGRATA